MEEFYNLTIRFHHMEDNAKKTTQYVNGLRSTIQDEINLMKFLSIEEGYQLALRVENKLARKQQWSSGSRGQSRGRGQQSNGRYQTLGRQEEILEPLNKELEKEIIPKEVGDMMEQYVVEVF